MNRAFFVWLLLTTINSLAQPVDTGQQVSIPVVFHIVHSEDDQNISEEQINSQLTSLNADFLRKNSDTVNTLPVFESVAGKSNISFFLATNGINRIPTSHGAFANSDIHYSSKGGADPWPTDRYLNIWVCYLPDGTFGFTSTSSSVENGIVIDYAHIGTIGTVSAPFDKGRTLTHEMGHWLGLKHLWGALGDCHDDDGIDDTPLQAGPSTGCNLDRNTCGQVNMVQNFMDTSDDACMNLFTKEQVKSMRKTLFADHGGLIVEGVISGVEQTFENEVYWYPFSEHTYKLSSKHEITSVTFYTMLGQQHHKVEFSAPTHEATVDTGNLRGMFVLQVNSIDRVYAIRVVTH